MHIFYSGSSNAGSLPEQVLADANKGRGPCLMLTHDEIYHKKGNAGRRFRDIVAERRGEHDGTGRVWMHFLDSGAFGLYNREVKQRAFEELFKAKKLNLEKFKELSAGERSAFKRQNGHLFVQTNLASYKYYDSEAFWERVDAYAAFVKKNRVAIDYYANLDVIYHPELTWRVQQYLEDKHQLDPVPVIHSCTPLKWVRHYLDRGYSFIALGGFGGSKHISYEDYMSWASKVFSLVCPLPNRIPTVKVHGFAMTNFDLMARFPWWSVDSATWAKAASYGHVYVPQYKGGRFRFDIPPHMIAASCEVSQTKPKYRPTNKHHMSALTPANKRQMEMWLEQLGIPLGTVDSAGDTMKWGVLSHHSARKIANLRYFELMEKNLPEWPWQLKRLVRERVTFNL